ncbi:porin family protein [Photobacterium alginatilyticum]|uniref:porin family protein n=1 Tax=Photobacterium alginatilyticum TaxID=1775171 RepID=UPI004069811E
MKKYLFFATLLAFSSFAGATTLENFYLGGAVGSTDFDGDGEYTSNSFLNSLFKYKAKEDGPTYKLIAGYQINDIVGIEAQYTSYGDVKIESQRFSFAKKQTLEHSSIVVAANIGYTFSNGIRPFGTLGLGSIKVEDNSGSDNGTAFRGGLGLEYAPSSLGGLNLRLAYEIDMFATESGTGTNKKEYSQSIGSFYVGTTYKF